MAQTWTRIIRGIPEQWERVEKTTEQRDISASRLVVELVMEALDRREWPHTELDVRSPRSPFLPPQILRLGLIAAGRNDEAEAILRFVTPLLPESVAHPSMRLPYPSVRATRIFFGRG